ncbi:hypothetical protein LIN78_10575 [Leeia sp. TBRC 13508]|uniref:DUF4194 domain-containing protein n=1 Tax=Leeia speluncae TaxID=2884804 RepID=A0ABS8D7H5_9NEIS|nr:hypothetical protein [Leeia speluncae]MCB6183988.1 hypothetical protein [Leeia speluncae]
MSDPIATLIARLLAHRVLPRHDPMARRALIDERFRQDLDQRLAASGLCLLENPYAEHISIALASEQIGPVFGSDDIWQTNNQGMKRDAIALLTVLWSLIILPKRQRQHSRRTREELDQADLFGSEKPMPTQEVASVLSEEALIADFGHVLGGKGRINMNLGQLARLGFIKRYNHQITEGPLLDLALDYSKLAPRIIDGALGDVLREMGADIPTEMPTLASEEDYIDEEPS